MMRDADINKTYGLGYVWCDSHVGVLVEDTIVISID